ncbi:MAG: hypothetical protein MI919_24525, partial [Holophagales bacterium]|nr:hypothetical protein [Holophagales bacterium]
MKLCHHIALLFLWASSPLAPSPPLLAAPGDLDCTFATGGTQRIDLGSASSILDMVLQADGKI